MGKWEKKLDDVLKLSEETKKIIDDSMGQYQKVVDAAQAFVSGRAKSAPKLTKSLSEMMDAQEECAAEPLPSSPSTKKNTKKPRRLRIKTK